MDGKGERKYLVNCFVFIQYRISFLHIPVSYCYVVASVLCVWFPNFHLLFFILFPKLSSDNGIYFCIYPPTLFCFQASMSG